MVHGEMQLDPKKNERSKLIWPIVCGILAVICVILLVLTIVFAKQRATGDEPATSTLANLRDYEAFAARTMKPELWEYTCGGAGYGVTTRANEAAFKQYRFRPRVMVNVEHVDSWLQVLGTTVHVPMGVAPLANLHWIRDGGDLSTALAAQNGGSIVVLSAQASSRIEDITALSAGTMWQEVYLFKEQNETLDFVKRIEETKKIKAIVLTIGRPTQPLWYRTYDRPASKMANFPHMDASDLANPTQRWKDVAWLVNSTHLDVVVRGVLTAEAARQAVASGAKAVIVSNQGGRFFDEVPASLDALSEVVDALNGTNVEVYFEGGIRSGMDIAKALMIGAKFVFIGRPVVWGLHQDGQSGVQGIFDILVKEFKNTLQMVGARGPYDFSTDFITKRTTYIDALKC